MGSTASRPSCNGKLIWEIEIRKTYADRATSKTAMTRMSSKIMNYPRLKSVAK